MTPHQAGKLLEPIKDKPAAMMAFVDLCEENGLDMRWLLEVPEHARYKKWLISLQLGVLEVKDIYPWMPGFAQRWLPFSLPLCSRLIRCADNFGLMRSGKLGICFAHGTQASDLRRLRISVCGQTQWRHCGGHAALSQELSVSRRKFTHLAMPQRFASVYPTTRHATG